MNKKEWFLNWFDSPYYHLLYKNRDEQEAQDFIDKLLDTLQPQAHAKILDLACGKGRFAKYINGKGFEVVGLDLSSSSIAEAQKSDNETLSFYQHDMRNLFRINYFDYVFNFFTSFGYFTNPNDNIKTLKAIKAGMKADGFLVLDYFNSNYIVKNLVKKEEKTVDKVLFDLSRNVEKDFVTKKIKFIANGKEYQFKEKVQLFNLSAFQQMFEKVGLELIATYGDYKLNPFDEKTSPRLILVAKKS